MSSPVSHWLPVSYLRRISCHSSRRVGNENSFFFKVRTLAGKLGRHAVVPTTSHKSPSPHADQTVGRPSWHAPPPHAVPTTCVCNYTHHSLTAPPAAVTHSPPALPSRSARRAALVIKSFGGTAQIDGESSRRVGGGGEGGGEERAAGGG